MSWIRMIGVNKSFGDTKVLRDIHFEVPTGGQYVIRGASGSGKSTLLYLLGGLDQQTSGEILVDQLNLSKGSEEDLAYYRNQTVGFVFQFHYLLPSMNCLKNILLPSRIGGMETKEVLERVGHLSQHLGVHHCLKKYPYEISGGEQQRVNIIRALSLRPKLLLCDEPTGNLDSKNSEKVTEILKELSTSYGATLLVVTHDKKVASQFSQEFFIEDGQLQT